MILGLERRLDKIRRSVEDPEWPGHCALFVILRYHRSMFDRTIAVVVQFSGGKEAELGRASSVLRAMVTAERNLHERRMDTFKPPQLVDVTPFLYQHHARKVAPATSEET